MNQGEIEALRSGADVRAFEYLRKVISRGRGVTTQFEMEGDGHKRLEALRKELERTARDRLRYVKRQQLQEHIDRADQLDLTLEREYMPTPQREQLKRLLARTNDGELALRRRHMRAPAVRGEYE